MWTRLGLRCPRWCPALYFIRTLGTLPKKGVVTVNKFVGRLWDACPKAPEARRGAGSIVFARALKPCGEGDFALEKFVGVAASGFV